jgi:molybdate transport system substrate-binding protein
MSRGLARLLLAGSLAAALGFGWALSRPGRGAPASVLVYCGAAMRAPMEAAVAGFERETGVRVQLQYGGSQTLLANAELSKQGDLFVPGDDVYLRKAREKELLDEIVPLGRMSPVLAVRRGNPKKIGGLADLLNPDVRLAQANPEAAAIGKLTREALGKAGRWALLKERTAVFKATVHEVGNDLKLDAADAGFLWDAVMGQYPELEAVAVPELAGAFATVSAGVLRSTANAPAALALARWLGARDRGLPDFARAGFQVVEGDAWAPSPELVLHAGAMLRPAIEATIAEFEAREGCRVLRVYNGCGILVAQMKAGERPDAYFACDEEFMKQVQDLYEPAAAVSVNQLVIVVKKGNPQGILRLKDLAKPGLRVGVGHEKQCALGALTQETLKVDGTLADVMRNVVVQVPAGDMLINQLKAGGLDAAVAYVSNAANAGDVLEAIPIDIPCALATQPVAVARTSPRKELARRLLAAFSSPRSKQRFLDEGFRWAVNGDAARQR